MKKKEILKISLLTILLLAVDMVSKYIFYNMGFLKDTYFIEPLLNYGISWGVRLPFFLIIVMSFVGIGMFWSMWKAKYFGWVVLAFLFAGTLGNLTDRLIIGGVRDFISIGTFPVFNMADSFLNVGVLLFLLKELRGAVR